MNAVSMNNLWMYLQGLSLTASNRKWLAEKLIEPSATSVPPILHTFEESEKEFERGEVLTGEQFNVECQALLDSFGTK